MRKIIIAFALLLVGVAVNGQTVDKLMKKYKDKPGVELIHVNKSMLTLAKLGGKEMNFGNNKISVTDDSKVKEVNILTFEGCGESLKKDFEKDFSTANLEDNGYELLLNTNEDDENVNIFAKKEGEICKEVVIQAIDKEDTVLVQIFGEIDLKKLMENADKD